MSKKILIDAVYPEETRVVIYENNLIQEFDYETASKKQIKGYIYLAKVTRVEPGLQAAFVEYSNGKHGFLPFSEIHPDYFHIPVSDRQKYKNIDYLETDSLANSNEGFTLPDFKIEKSKPTIVKEFDAEEIILQQNSDIDSKIETNEDVDSSDDLEINEVIDEEETFSKNSSILEMYKNYKIHEVIKRNQIILVQTIKEERGNKGPSFTSYISLAGRYCVFMPNSNRQGGISRRITDVDDRKKIKDIIDELNISGGSSIIVRTAGASKDKAEIERDYDYLLKLWNNIREHTLNSTAPAFIHAESDIIKRTIRDLYDEKVNEIVIQGDNAYRLAKDFVKKIIPNNSVAIRQYKSKTPLFCKFQIEEQLASLYNPTTILPSGGYIVMNPTEALISIDVNSGKSTSERNVEETAFKTNCEAVIEITRQLRLRDLSGLIVIDFIDMMDTKNRKHIEKHLRDFLKFDRAKIQVGLISEFGLLEMSRQRLRSNFLEANTVSCPSCNGKGLIRSDESNSVMILRTVESEIYKGDFELINIYACANAVLYILNHKRDDIIQIEKRYNTKLIFNNDPHASNDGFSIERIKRISVSKSNELVDISPEYQIIEQITNIEPSEIIESKPDVTNKPKQRRKIIKRKSSNKDVVLEDEIIPSTEHIKPEEEAISAAKIERKKKINNYRRKRKAQKKTEENESGSLIKGFLKKILE